MQDVKIRGYTVAQPPNPPLWVAIAGAAVGWIADDGSTLDDVAGAAFYMGLTVWAYEEAVNGVNNFRRALGVAGLAFIVVSLARRLGP